jgi:RNA polymerase sigma-70 factor (ECF subfamily)
MSDQENILLQRFAHSGDAEAFSQIVNLHSSMVYGACLRVLGDTDKAMDAAQETFFQLLKNAETITGSLAGWLHRVATRKAIDLIRKDSTRRRHHAQYSPEKPKEASQWKDISPHIDQALGEIDDQTRRIIIDHYLQSKSQAEIADQQEISQATVSRRINAGITLLREKLQKRGLIIAAAALANLFTQNAVEAAPAMLAKELAKMSLVAAGSSATAVSTTAAASTTKAAAAVTTGIKAKIITAAAVAVIGAGSVIVYKQTQTNPTPLLNPAASPNSQTTTNRSTTPKPRSTANATPAQQSPEDVGAEFDQFMADLQQSAQQQPEPVAATPRTASSRTTRSATPGQRPVGGMGRGGFGGGGFGGARVSSTNLSTPQATATTFARALSSGSFAQIAACFAPGADDLEDLRKIMQNPQTQAEKQMKQCFESIGPPAEIIDSNEEANGLSVNIQFTVNESFSVGQKTFEPGDSFELDMRLVQLNNQWRIAGI